MTQANEQTVFVVDDDAAVRDSIAELAESVGLCVEGYASAQDFLDAYAPGRTGCLVLDVRMGDMSGLALQERLNALQIDLPVIFLTGHGDVPMAVDAMKSGAVDFLQKPCREQALLDSINSALAMDAAARWPGAAQNEFERRLATLTRREREVLDELRLGSTSKEVGRRLSMSPRTAEVHRSNLLRKLGFASLKELLCGLSAREGGGRQPPA